MKLQPQTATLTLTHSQLTQPVIHPQQLCPVQASEVWVDAGGILDFDEAPGGPEPQWAGQMDFAAAERKMPSPQGPQAIAHFTACTGAQLNGLGHVLHAQPIGDVIEHLNRQRLRGVVFQGQTYFAPATQRQAAGHMPMHTRRRSTAQSRGVQQGQQQQRQEQAPRHRVQGGGHLELQGGCSA